MLVLCFSVPQIFGSEPKEEETEVCFVDIVYDEIPERHYKESEVQEAKSWMKKQNKRVNKWERIGEPEKRVVLHV